jgi:hypothetical protein
VNASLLSSAAANSVASRVERLNGEAPDSKHPPVEAGEENCRDAECGIHGITTLRLAHGNLFR